MREKYKDGCGEKEPFAMMDSCLHLCYDIIISGPSMLACEGAIGIKFVSELCVRAPELEEL